MTKIMDKEVKVKKAKKSKKNTSKKEDENVKDFNDELEGGPEKEVVPEVREPPKLTKEEREEIVARMHVDVIAEARATVELRKFSELVFKMRHWQRLYYTGGSDKDLVKSKRYEREVDLSIERHRKFHSGFTIL